ARRGEYTAVDIREPHEVMLADLPAEITTQKLPLSSINSDDEVADFFSQLGESQVLVYCAAGQRSTNFVERYEAVAHRAGVVLERLSGALNGLSRPCSTSLSSKPPCLLGWSSGRVRRPRVLAFSGNTMLGFSSTVLGALASRRSTSPLRAPTPAPRL